MENIVKVAVLHIIDKKLLMCRKKGLDFLISLGGKINLCETDEECAVRETCEEAQCGVSNLNYYMTISVPRGDEPGEIELRFYFGNLVGLPTPRSEDSVYGFVYVGKDWEKEGHKVSPSAKIVIEKLAREGYL